MSDHEQVPDEDLEAESTERDSGASESESEAVASSAESSDSDTFPASSASSPAITPIEPAPAHDRAPNMLPGRERRRSEFERVVVRTVATGGVIGIGVAVAAILGANHVQAWITGLVVSALSVLLAAVLWSSQRL